MSEPVTGQRTVGHLTVAARFNGPPGSGNGGYVCGRIAEHLPGDVRVRLLLPPPLERDLELIETRPGFELRDRGRIVARAWPISLELSALPPLSPEEARALSARYAGFRHHAFPSCFVCGPDRAAGDGLRIFPGRGDDPSRVACTWTPDAGLTGPDGTVLLRYTWAALDCPSGWAWLHALDAPALLGELAVHVEQAPRAGEEHVIVGWQCGSEGRKLHSRAALYSSTGRPLATAVATWIRLDPFRPPGQRGQACAEGS